MGADANDTATTTTAPESPAETAVETAPYAFPFEVPADYTGMSDEDLRALHAQVREHASTFAGRSPAEIGEDTLAALRACRDLATAVAGELTGRRDRAEEAAQFAAEIEDTTPDDGDVFPDPDPAPAPTVPAPTDPPAAVTATTRRPAAPPRVRDVARNAGAPQLPASMAPRHSMTAAADAPGFRSGAALDTFGEAVKALSAAMDRNSSMTAARAGGGGYDPNMRPVTVYDPAAPARVFEMTRFNRSSVVELRRAFPEDQRVSEDGDNGYAVAEYVSGERRLPGGNLRASAMKAVEAGRSLTAAAGWCAPSETLYDLLELESLDGLLNAPEMQASRGGFRIPINGGPDFGVIYNGNFLTTHRTEAQVKAGSPAKTATEIPCPDFEEVTLGVDYISLTGGLLQRRGYPEAVKRFTTVATIALAHRINQQFIAAIENGSGAINVIPADPSGDDAASALLATVEMAIVDAKYRVRHTFAGTMEAVLPWWILAPIRAALSRRSGVAQMAVTDAQILSWFTERKAVPRLVYDWQDSASGIPSGPGGSAPIKSFPSTVDVMVYPAGTWVKAVQPVVSLDTLYDSTLLQTNQYQAVFVEDGWAALKMSPISRRYRVRADPSGVVACCSDVNS